MRDKQFFINSIKMDLYRVVTSAGNINNGFPVQAVVEFMQHANRDFEKVKLTEREIGLREDLRSLLKQVESIKDPLSRLRWAEKVLTIRSRL